MQRIPCDAAYARSMPVELSELELIWPAELFAQEARVLLSAGCRDVDDLGLLLAEAFHRDRGFRLISEVVDAERRTSSWDLWSDPTNGLKAEPSPSAASDLVGELAERADQLPVYRPRLYYSARLHPPPPQPVLSPTELMTAFAEVVGDLSLSGYFDEAFGNSCCDSDDNPDGEGQRQLVAVTGHRVPMWPLVQQGHATGLQEHWSEEQFFDVVEALHDIVARPRRRWPHDHCREWDYADHVRASGQAVYRWRVNCLLARSDTQLRLAGDRDECGLLVQHQADGRDELVRRLEVSDSGTPPDDEVRHAIALWRRRGATQQDKRSAVAALARVLEDRRSLLKHKLFSDDEAALFTIANSYDLRHRGASQRADYDTVFLDWVFWWYLATVELTDRLLARQSAP